MTQVKKEDFDNFIRSKVEPWMRYSYEWIYDVLMDCNRGNHDYQLKDICNYLTSRGIKCVYDYMDRNVNIGDYSNTEKQAYIDIFIDDTKYYRCMTKMDVTLHTINNYVKIYGPDKFTKETIYKIVIVNDQNTNPIIIYGSYNSFVYENKKLVKLGFNQITFEFRGLDTKNDIKIYEIGDGYELLLGSINTQLYNKLTLELVKKIKPNIDLNKVLDTYLQNHKDQ